MRKFNVSVPRQYEKDGETKTAWNTVGKLVQFEATAEKEEGFILELHMFPGTKFGVFPDVPRQQKDAQPAPADEPSIDL